MTFKPGQSGNPNGRPRATAELARKIREKTRDGDLLIEIAIRTLDADDAASRNYAHQWLSDRSFGKALATIDVLDTAAITPEQIAMLNALHMTPHERRARLAELRARAAATAVVVQSEPHEGDE